MKMMVRRMEISETIGITIASSSITSGFVDAEQFSMYELTDRMPVTGSGATGCGSGLRLLKSARIYETDKYVPSIM